MTQQRAAAARASTRHHHRHRSREMSECLDHWRGPKRAQTSFMDRFSLVPPRRRCVGHIGGYFACPAKAASFKRLAGRFWRRQRGDEGNESEHDQVDRDRPCRAAGPGHECRRRKRGEATASILMAFHDELHARGPHRLNRPAEPVTECGFWGDMAAGMSCR